MPAFPMFSFFPTQPHLSQAALQPLSLPLLVVMEVRLMPAIGREGEGVVMGDGRHGSVPGEAGGSGVGEPLLFSLSPSYLLNCPCSLSPHTPLLLLPYHHCCSLLTLLHTAHRALYF